MATHVSNAFVLRAGSSGRNLLYSSTSFSMERTSDWSLARRAGKVSRMWLTNVWGRTHNTLGKVCQRGESFFFISYLVEYFLKIRCS